MEINIKKYSATDITNDLKRSIQYLLKKAFFNSHMYESFVEDLGYTHKYFSIFLAFDKNKLIGCIVLEDKIHNNCEYFGYEPVHIKRFTVDPDYRGYQVGKKLLDAAKQEAFDIHNLPVIFGQSNEVGAIAFYLREGALFSKEIIEGYNLRNSPSDNLIFFQEFIENKKFLSYRYPSGSGLNFVYVKNDTEKKKMGKNLFFDKDSLFT